ncbi:hypothetical protein [Microseira sp. BLCC-F43]|uniref:hypothetical protein n=1 Tax=Microseira sp. BLCC-F43 TaxID=3153602 RepID=UPI0035B70EA2
MGKYQARFWRVAAIVRQSLTLIPTVTSLFLPIAVFGSIGTILKNSWLIEILMPLSTLRE